MKTALFLVDEKPAQLSMLQEFFSMKCDISVYHGGKIAFRSALREKPELILLDSQISDIDAHELCRLFKEHEALQKTRVVMLYPQTDISRCKQCYEYGADDYLLKPFFKHELLARVRVLLKTPRFLTLPGPVSPFDVDEMGKHAFSSMIPVMS